MAIVRHKVNPFGRPANFCPENPQAASREQVGTGAIKDINLFRQQSTPEANCRGSQANGLPGFIITKAEDRSSVFAGEL